MKQCSRMAAFQGKQVVLLVHQDLGADCLLDASIFMNEGKFLTVIWNICKFNAKLIL